jgi:hypothetical protein
VPIKIVSVGPDRDQTIERYTEDWYIAKWQTYFLRLPFFTLAGFLQYG